MARAEKLERHDETADVAERWGDCRYVGRLGEDKRHLEIDKLEKASIDWKPVVVVVDLDCQGRGCPSGKSPLLSRT